MELGRMSSQGNGLPISSPPPSLSGSSPDNSTERAKNLGLRQDDTRLDIDIPGNPHLGVEDTREGDGENSPLLGRDDIEQQAVGPREWLGPRPEESLAEIEINSLLWIKSPGNEALKEAYESWQAKDVLFAKRVDKKKEQSNSLMNEIYQLIGFYSVFQGVLLTAVAQSSLLYCHNWWTAFCLSLLASLVTVGGVIQKFLAVLSLEVTISSEEMSRKDCIRRVRSLLQNREKFQLRTVPDDRRRAPELKRLKLSAVLVVLVLLLFSALFLASIRLVLCDPGEAPAPGV